MKVITQRTVNTIVRRKDESVISETIYLDREREIKGSIVCDIHNLEITESKLEIMKYPETNMTDGVIHLPYLLGAKADIEGKRMFQEMLSSQRDKMPLYLMKQCINGIIQGESYFYQERGFDEKEDYNSYWDEIEKNGCRMYTHPDSEDKRWLDYIPELERRETLFTRSKTFSLTEKENMKIYRGSFMDSFHELNVEIICDINTDKVLECDISYSKAPGKSCFENPEHASKIIGKNINKLDKNDIINTFGRCEGCYHLVEIIRDTLSLF